MSTTMKTESDRRIQIALTPDRQLFVGAEDAAALCGVSRSTWLSWDRDGLCPRRIVIGGCVRWSRLQLAQWSAAGAPDRAAFEGSLSTDTIKEKKVDRESRISLTSGSMLETIKA